MKKFLLGLTVLAGLQANAQITLFQDDFESYQDFIITGIGQWTVWDMDGLPTYIGGVSDPSEATWPNAGAPMAFQIFNPAAAGVQNNLDGENSNFDPHSGAKYAACWDAVPGDGADANNDWLISPPITLGVSGNTLSFYVMSLSPDYGLDKYNVGIYEGTTPPTSPNDFTLLTGGGPKSAPADGWTLDNYDLDSYANKTIYFAINCVSSDNYMLKVDDVLVTTNSLGTAEVSGQNGLQVYAVSNGVYALRTKKDIKSTEVYSVDGKTVLTQTDSKNISLSGKPAGVYIVKVNFKDGSAATQKVIKR